MKKYFLLLAAALMLTACTKEPELDPIEPDVNSGEEETLPIEKFIGEWDLLITPDSVGVDNDWYSNEEYEQLSGEPNDGMYGFMTINKVDDTHVSITSRIKFEGEEMYDYTSFYETEGELTSDNTLTLVNRPFTAESGLEVNMDYRPLIYGDSIEFKTVMHIDFGSMQFHYLYKNVIKAKH